MKKFKEYLKEEIIEEAKISKKDVDDIAGFLELTLGNSDMKEAGFRIKKLIKKVKSL